MSEQRSHSDERRKSKKKRLPQRQKTNYKRKTEFIGWRLTVKIHNAENLSSKHNDMYCEVLPIVGKKSSRMEPKATKLKNSRTGLKWEETLNFSDHESTLQAIDFRVMTEKRYIPGFAGSKSVANWRIKLSDHKRSKKRKKQMQWYRQNVEEEKLQIGNSKGIEDSILIVSWQYEEFYKLDVVKQQILTPLSSIQLPESKEMSRSSSQDDNKPRPTLPRRRSYSVSSVESFSDRPSDELVDLFRRLHLGKQMLQAFVEQDILDIKDLLLMESEQMEHLIPTFGKLNRLKAWMNGSARSPTTHRNRKKDKFGTFPRKNKTAEVYLDKIPSHMHDGREKPSVRQIFDEIVLDNSNPSPKSLDTSLHRDTATRNRSLSFVPPSIRSLPTRSIELVEDDLLVDSKERTPRLSISTPRAKSDQTHSRPHNSCGEYLELDQIVEQHKETQYFFPSQLQQREVKCVYIEYACLKQIQAINKSLFNYTYKAKYHLNETVNDVIVKVPSGELLSSRDYKHEKTFLQTIPEHENVAKLLGECLLFEYVDTGPSGLVLQYYHNGSLRSFLNKNEPFREEHQLRRLAHQMSLAVQHLHNNGYVHRDIAMRNFVVSIKCEAVIIDFGLTRRLTEIDQNGIKGKLVYKTLNSFYLPFRWCPPERLQQEISTRASDIWMLGMTFWEMCHIEKELFEDVPTPKAMIHLFDKTKAAADSADCAPLLFAKSCPKSLKNLIRKMCRFDEANRPDVDHVVQMLAK